MASEGTWREHPFLSGTKYRVKKDFSYLETRAVAGSIVIYDSCGYERYDNMSLFRFYEKSSTFSKRKELIWPLHDDEADSKFDEYFLALS